MVPSAESGGPVAGARRTEGSPTGVYCDMHQWTEVRRAVLVEGISKREACRRFGIHWDTLERMLEESTS